MISLEKVHYQCPFCGYKNHQFYDPMSESPPYCFRCTDCHRHFGDESNMSFTDRIKIYDEARECADTMRMAELDSVINTVEIFFRNFRPGSGQLPIVVIRDGKIENYNYNISAYQLLATYSVTSPISDQWLCVQCYRHLCKMMPYTTFQLGDYGISLGQT